MKKVLILMGAAAIMGACKETERYTLSGDITGLNGKIYIEADNGRTDSVTVMKGRFETVLPIDEPMMVVVSSAETPWAMELLIDGPKTVLTGNLDGEITAEGSESQKAYDMLNEEKQELIALYYDPLTTETEKDLIEEQADSLTAAYLGRNRGNLLGSYLLSGNAYGMSSGEIEREISLFPENMRSGFYLRTLAEQAEKMKATEEGNRYINVALPDAQGDMLSLSDYVGEGRYVLLDFWASWCGPCMREVPYLTDTYAAYHDKGFEIFGVSLDKKRDAWLGAIAANGMDWPQTSLLEGWENPAAADYSVRSIPSNFLIGPDGTIIAKNLRGEALREKVSELLGEPSGSRRR